MNIVGKLLVIANLIFAVATGGFLVVDYATRRNWKSEYDDLRTQMDISRTNGGVTAQTLDRINKEVRNKVTELNTLKQKFDDSEATANVRYSQLEAIKNGLDARVKEAELLLLKANNEVRLMTDEITLLNTTIAKRETEVSKLIATSQDYKADAVAKNELAKQVQSRNEELLAQLAKKEREIIRLTTGSSTPDKGVIRDLNEPNPPPVKVEGVIVTVSTRDNRVEISVGSDQGLEKGHTLDVYRLTPQPAYLGMIRIEDVDHHNAVARRIVNGGSTPSPLREGDKVATSVSSRN